MCFPVKTAGLNVKTHIHASDCNLNLSRPRRCTYTITCTPTTQAYTRVAPAVAVFPEYCAPLARHLVTTQLRHWDKGLRELCARAAAALAPTGAARSPFVHVLGAWWLHPLPIEGQHCNHKAHALVTGTFRVTNICWLRSHLLAVLVWKARFLNHILSISWHVLCCVPGAGAYLASEALDGLLPLCLDPVLEVRHGAVVGVAELLPALKHAGIEVSQERLDKVSVIKILV